MVESYQRLINGNRNWAETTLKKDPLFFENLSKGQKPEFLWIGCSDSRVPANEITGTVSGEIFVHRNIANLVIPTDFSLLSVLQFAIEVLKVKHIIVCGHYGCGGVAAALTNQDYGLSSYWFQNIKQVYTKYSEELEAIKDERLRYRKLVEYNVIEQVRNLARTRIVQNAWKENTLEIHGWVYGIEDGLVKDLEVVFQENSSIEQIFRI